ncbi:MAG: hypothetical protein H0W90_01360 [Actinobacteria bacterium]|nr:hypothetical protein [Actinomycetota bacterium]
MSICVGGTRHARFRVRGPDSFRAFLTEVALAASALAELRHGKRNVGLDTLKRLLHHA